MTLYDYIEEYIIPRYKAFDKAHNLDHVAHVIERSLKLASHYDVNTDMVYTIAAYHDVGLCEGRERHHIVSGEILSNDVMLSQWFTPQEIATMREAVEDHRASNGHEPRSLYGCIVAEADRLIDPDTTLRRTVQYGLKHLEVCRGGLYAIVATSWRQCSAFARIAQHHSRQGYVATLVR